MALEANKAAADAKKLPEKEKKHMIKTGKKAVNDAELLAKSLEAAKLVSLLCTA